MSHRRGAVAPDNSTGEYGFDFTRFGVRVPTVLVSPLIEPGTVFRATAGGAPVDHTSVLRTVELRWGLPSLTARDAAAPDIGAVLTLTKPRVDDPLAGVTVPVSGEAGPSADLPSHLLQGARRPGFAPGGTRDSERGTQPAHERRLHGLHPQQDGAVAAGRVRRVPEATVLRREALPPPLREAALAGS